jgi:hypothetical protein
MRQLVFAMKKLIIFILMLATVHSQGVKKVKMEIKADFDEIIHTKNHEITVINEKIREHLIPFVQQFSKMLRFFVSCPMTPESIELKNIVSYLVSELTDLFETSFVNDVLSEVIISIASFQDLINNIDKTLPDDAKNAKCLECERKKFSVIFLEFIDATKSTLHHDISVMQLNLSEIGNQVELFVAILDVDIKDCISQNESMCDCIHDYVRAFNIVITPKIDFSFTVEAKF